jgi:hypothetical protein
MTRLESVLKVEQGPLPVRMGPNEEEMGLKEEVEEEEAIVAAAVVVREVREEGRIDDK